MFVLPKKLQKQFLYLLIISFFGFCLYYAYQYMSFFRENMSNIEEQRVNFLNKYEDSSDMKETPEEHEFYEKCEDQDIYEKLVEKNELDMKTWGDDVIENRDGWWAPVDDKLVFPY